MEGANMQEIIKMAQQVASNITQNNESVDMNNLDMSKMIAQVTESVSKMVTPEFIGKMSGDSSIPVNQMNPNIKSKINLEKPEASSIREMKSDDSDDGEYETLAPRTKDLHFTLNVTLDELYLGKTKKLAVRRKRIVTNGKTKKLVEEKKKISINIEPGMHDEQVITFNKQADEKEGYETGDIIITLCCVEHDEFERENNNLIVEKEISLFEAYKCDMTITHIDGRDINIKSLPINVFGDELDCYRKLKNFGMPIHGSDGEFGDLIIKFQPVLPDKISEEQLNLLENLFPKLNTKKESGEIHELELATDSDFEYSDSEYDSDYESGEESGEESDEEESGEESDSESEEEEKKSNSKDKVEK